MSQKTDLWYPFFVGDYRRDTARLSCEQHGAYRQLIDEYWITGPLPDDDAVLARIVGLDVRTWRKHRPHIVRFFTVDCGVWRHGRIDRELEAAKARKEKAGSRAKAGAEARWGKRDASRNASSILEAMPERVLGSCPPPSPSSPPDGGVEDAVASLSPAGDEKPEYPEEFEACWKAYPHVRGRSSKSKSLGYWRRISAGRRSLLPSAIARYAREGREPKEDCGAPAMDRWLRDQRYLDWLQAPEASHQPWPGPPEVVAIVADHLGDPKAAEAHLRLYFTWRDDSALVTKSVTMFERVKGCRSRLEARGWKLVLEDRAA